MRMCKCVLVPVLVACVHRTRAHVSSLARSLARARAGTGVFPASAIASDIVDGIRSYKFFINTVRMHACACSLARLLAQLFACRRAGVCLPKFLRCVSVLRLGPVVSFRSPAACACIPSANQTKLNPTGLRRQGDGPALLGLRAVRLPRSGARRGTHMRTHTHARTHARTCIPCRRMPLNAFAAPCTPRTPPRLAAGRLHRVVSHAAPLLRLPPRPSFPTFIRMSSSPTGGALPCRTVCTTGKIALMGPLRLVLLVYRQMYDAIVARVHRESLTAAASAPGGNKKKA